MTRDKTRFGASQPIGTAVLGAFVLLMGLVGPAAYLLMSGPWRGQHWEGIMFWELGALVVAIIGLLCARRQRMVWGWAVLQNLAAVVFMYSLVPIE